MPANVLTQMAYGGSLAAADLADGAALPTSVIPFLLRSMNLLGIVSVMQPREIRLSAWQRITKDCH